MIDLSIVVPVYNAQHHILPMLSSIIMQDTTGINVQYIFTFDSCKDKSYEMVKSILEYSGLIDKCILKEIEVHSAGAARNIAFDLCEGEYIWCLDDDDWLISDIAFRTVVRIMRKYDLKLLRIPFEAESWEFCTYEHLRSVISMPWQWILRRDLIGEDRFPAEPSIGYDTVFVEKMLLKSEIGQNGTIRIRDIPTLDTKLYYYNAFRPGSAMYYEALRTGCDPNNKIPKKSQ